MKYDRYSSYKSSGDAVLTNVPFQWTISRIAHVFTKSNAGEVIDKSYWGEGNEVLYTCNRTPLQSDFPAFPAWKRTGISDLLLTRNGTPYVHQPVPSAIYSNVVQRVTLASAFYREYLTYCLGNAALGMKGYGVSIESFNFDNWKSLRFAYPCVSEQVQIARFLDYETARIDALIEKQQQLISLLKEKRQAVISHAVTKGLNPNAPLRDCGVEWLGMVPAHWEVKRLKHISSRIGVGLVINPSTYTRDEGVYFIFGGDVKEHRFDLSAARHISQRDSDRLAPSRLGAGDLVCVRVGDPGVTAVVTPELEGANCASVIIVRNGQFDSNWLCSAMNSWVGRHQVGLVSYGAAQKQFNVSDAVEFVFPVPPRQEQREIAEFIGRRLERFERLTANAEMAVALFGERRTALISAAVTGKIDVRGWAPPESSVEQDVA